ncbi:MAG: hypothetical protein KJN60_02045 [Boseongicola sp.]|nr:hypothetical protein [Boseongicola sp.]
MPYGSIRLGITMSTLISLLPGCSEDVVAFNYDARPENPVMTADVVAGRRFISDLLGSEPCILNVDMNISNIDDEIFGEPGQTGFNMSFSVANPANRISLDEEACPKIDDFVLFYGAPNETLPTLRFSEVGRVAVTAASRNYRSDLPGGYFRARISDYDSANTSVAGEFRALAVTDDSQPDETLLIEGSFNVGN